MLLYLGLVWGSFRLLLSSTGDTGDYAVAVVGITYAIVLPFLLHWLMLRSRQAFQVSLPELVEVEKDLANLPAEANFMYVSQQQKRRHELVEQQRRRNLLGGFGYEFYPMDAGDSDGGDYTATKDTTWGACARFFLPPGTWRPSGFSSTNFVLIGGLKPNYSHQPTVGIVAYRNYLESKAAAGDGTAPGQRRRNGDDPFDAVVSSDGETSPTSTSPRRNGANTNNASTASAFGTLPLDAMDDPNDPWAGIPTSPYVHFHSFPFVVLFIAGTVVALDNFTQSNCWIQFIILAMVFLLAAVVVAALSPYRTKFQNVATTLSFLLLSAVCVFGGTDSVRARDAFQAFSMLLTMLIIVRILHLLIVFVYERRVLSPLLARSAEAATKQQAVEDQKYKLKYPQPYRSLPGVHPTPPRPGSDGVLALPSVQRDPAPPYRQSYATPGGGGGGGGEESEPRPLQRKSSIFLGVKDGSTEEKDLMDVLDALEQQPMPRRKSSLRLRRRRSAAGSPNDGFSPDAPLSPLASVPELVRRGSSLSGSPTPVLPLRSPLSYRDEAGGGLHRAGSVNFALPPARGAIRTPELEDPFGFEYNDSTDGGGSTDSDDRADHPRPSRMERKPSTIFKKNVFGSMAVRAMAPDDVDQLANTDATTTTGNNQRPANADWLAETAVVTRAPLRQDTAVSDLLRARNQGVGDDEASAVGSPSSGGDYRINMPKPQALGGRHVEATSPSSSRVTAQQQQEDPFSWVDNRRKQREQREMEELL